MESSNSMSLIMELIKKLILMIFEKYEVNKEFEAIGFDINNLFDGAAQPEEKA